MTELNCKSLTDLPTSSTVEKPGKPTKTDKKKDKIHLWKNIIILDLAIFFYHSPMMTYTNIMSSLNSDEGQGLASESINAGILLLGSLLLCTYGTKRWTSKSVILVACVLTIPYLLINFYVVWATIIPGSIMAGFGDCLITQAVSVYYSDLASYYSKNFDSDRETFLLKMFGLCGVVLQGSFILGNVLVWTVLDTSNLWSKNETETTFVESSQFCGPRFCHDTVWGNSTLPHPSQWRIYTLCGTFTVMGVLAVVFVFFLDDFSQVDSKKVVPKFKDVVIETVRLLGHPQQMLLVAMTTLLGLAEGFFFGDYTQAYVSCSIGISQVGLVMICYGMVNGVCAACQEALSGWLGRVPVMTVGSALLASLTAVLLYWQPQNDHVTIFYLVAALWGLADGILSTHVSTLFGTLYEDKPQVAYSCQTFWYGVGLCLSFGYSYYLCISVKLYILCGVTIGATVGYYILEIHLYCTRRKKQRSKTLENFNPSLPSNNNEEEQIISSIPTISGSISQTELLTN